MDTASPPSYSRAPGSGSQGTVGDQLQLPPPVLLNLAPHTDAPDATSFQAGQLGGADRTQPTRIAGEVQIKVTRSAADSAPAYHRLEVVFRGLERTDSVTSGSDAAREGDEITLVEQRSVLWEAASEAVGTSGADSSRLPPPSSPFQFELTPDLPTCLHLCASSLTYTLTATLYPDPSSQAEPLSRSAPVHLVRTAPPSALLPVRPASVTASDPITWRARFPRTSFTRREPIGLVVRVDVPDSKRIGQGLRLRTISAELVRTITVSPSTAASTSRADSTAAGERSVRRTVLAHSGKSARFSPSRPIIIRLVLHPPLDPTCESITQSTLLHAVSFAVVVNVGLVKAAGAAADPDGPSTSALSGPLPCDSVLTQEITILPDLPATDPTPRSDKQKEVEQAAAASSASTSALEGLSPSVTADASPWDEEQPVPSYVENSLLDPGTTLSPTASTSSRWLPGEDDVSSSAQSGSELPPSGYALSASVDDGEDEEEYDGYEELSLPASLSGRAPPPRIDDDISPPSMGEPSSMRDYRPAPGYGTDRGDGDLFLSGGTPDSLQPPPHASERISGDSHDALDIPETPPPVVDYDLPFLGAAAASAVSEIGTLSTVMPPIESLGSSVPSTPPSPGADEATVPSYSGHAPTGVPSSPPPPVSPLDSDHPSLPPFSASPPAAYQAREESSSSVPCERTSGLAIQAASSSAAGATAVTASARRATSDDWWSGSRPRCHRFDRAGEFFRLLQSG
ncbi:hypothetical protein JCM8202v2_000420 [Rhodotorula sphaerocarpa]